jgi:hypothetical protein
MVGMIAKIDTAVAWMLRGYFTPFVSGQIGHAERVAWDSYNPPRTLPRESPSRPFTDGECAILPRASDLNGRVASGEEIAELIGEARESRCRLGRRNPVETRRDCTKRALAMQIGRKNNPHGAVVGVEQRSVVGACTKRRNDIGIACDFSVGGAEVAPSFCLPAAVPRTRMVGRRTAP